MPSAEMPSVPNPLLSMEKPDTAITSILGGSPSAVVPHPAGGSPAGSGSFSQPGSALFSSPTVSRRAPRGRKTQGTCTQMQVLPGGSVPCQSWSEKVDIFPALFFVLLEHKCVSPGRGSPLRTGAGTGQGRRSNEDKSGRTGKPGERAGGDSASPVRGLLGVQFRRPQTLESEPALYQAPR